MKRNEICLHFLYDIHKQSFKNLPIFISVLTGAQHDQYQSDLQVNICDPFSVGTLEPKAKFLTSVSLVNLSLVKHPLKMFFHKAKSLCSMVQTVHWGSSGDIINNSDISSKAWAK